VQDSIPDLAKILKQLADHHCRYVMIGGMAAVMHGSAVITYDCDLAVYFDSENRANLVEALRPLHPRPLRWKGGRPFEFDEKCIVGPWTLLQTDAGRVDLIVRLAGVDSFDGLYERSICDDFQGVPIRYAALDDLIAMKDHANRGKDQANVLYLKGIRQVTSTESENG
jgi:predicted nucleotidyltransferase